ncbi:arylsulfatase [Flammeovirga kamogawensis]|uniref:Arylsulfatase n=1 Tax=Flammeovirga kamogawensis TaxID=373891 RepID=A0ABX8H5W6_9BACT|nr:arylsulfatase [Flammeovirga kamogawensis]MBB6461816.1 arylsulfatase [Flammeovirga kamogawensis]QWG10732.1 arylsulfatase [Flammeovirga kamogawensis]TRX63834.1 arylsulfatase [Flammeovirga kamogawensis]
MKTNLFTLLAVLVGLSAFGQNKATKKLKGSKPNIIMIVSDDTGWGDFGSYGGGEGRGMATPNFDRMDQEGMQFWDFYGQPSCTPGRAAMQTGRIPNRSGMTTVAFQGQGGGLAHGEITIADVLKSGGYNTYFAGKWHLGESDYAMPTAHGYDKMESVILYHLNAYTYTMKSFHPGMTDEQIAFYKKATTGILEGEAGQPVREISKVTEENLPELDVMMTDNVIKQLDTYAKDKDKPFFMSVNFAKNHQPNIPGKDFVGKSAAKTKYADAVCELDHHVGQILDEVERLGISENTLILFTVDNGAWQDVYPDAGYTPFRGTKGTDREAGSRVPAYAMWKGVIEPGADNYNIVGGLDYLATFANLAGVEVPTEDRDGKPTVFDSYDMTPLLTGDNDAFKRDTWFYFTEQELSPGAVRVGRWKATFNLRGDNGAVAGSTDSPNQSLGWTGPEKYAATTPAIYDLWSDPQERYDVFMTSFTENTWTLPIFIKEMTKLQSTYEKYPPRPVQSEAYDGVMTIKRFNDLRKINTELKKEGADFEIKK